MSFDISKLPLPVQLVFRVTGPSLWPTVAFGAMACGVKDPSLLTDIAFHLNHPELGGRTLKSNEKALVAEWRSYYRAIKKMLEGTPSAPPPAKPSGGGSTNKCYTPEGLVEAAIANIRKTEN